jgi:hypothetical protein
MTGRQADRKCFVHIDTVFVNRDVETRREAGGIAWHHLRFLILIQGVRVRRIRVKQRWLEPLIGPPLIINRFGNIASAAGKFEHQPNKNARNEAAFL